MKIKVTVHVEFPDDWVENTDDTCTPGGIIKMLENTGVADGLRGSFDDEIVDAEIINPK